jgi:hypothetical protein
MTKFYFSAITFTLLLFISTNLTAQQSLYPENSPEWLVDMFFKQVQFTNKANFLTGEMLQDIKYPTIGEELHGSATVSFRKIEIKSFTAVYAVDISGNGSNAAFYCFLKKADDIWRIDAIRKFQLPKFVYTAADSLAKISNSSPSDILLLNSLKLITGSDENLKSSLSKNINDLYEIISAFNSNNKDRLKLLMDKLGLDYIYKDELYPECVFILITGFERIEAGYIYSGTGLSLPTISPGRFIYIEEVLPNWYVYRAM